MASPILPLDVLIHVLSVLPPSRTNDESIKTFVSFGTVSHLFREAVSVPSIWKSHYETRYLECDKDKENERKAHLEDNWASMYAERRRIDRAAADLLDRMVMDRPGRYSWAKDLFKFGFDVWDFLELEAGQSLSGILTRDPKLVTYPYALPRIYWAKTVLVAIAKSYAFQMWNNLLAVSFTDTFSTLSTFFGISPMRISGILDDLTKECRRYLLDKKCAFPLTHPEYNISEVSVSICNFMHSQGFGPCDPGNFHDMRNHFPHFYLTSHRNAIPISLVHVFVAIAQGLGLTAFPVAFPARVLALVSSPQPDVEDIYVDVYGAKSQAILSLRGDVPALLAQYGVSPDATTPFTRPASSTTMLLRSSRNMLTAVHFTTTPRNLTRTAVYLSIAVHITFANQHALLETMIDHADLVDCATCLPEALAPALEDVVSDELQELCKKALSKEAESAEIVKSRPDNLLGFVGMIFRHRAYNYVACIFGWDPVCKANEEWIQTMNIDTSLDRGRNQAFYSVYMSDGSRRYVAEDNLRAVYDLSPETLAGFFQEIPLLLSYFSHVEMCDTPGGKRARFVPGPDLQSTYPDDEDFGRKWVTSVEWGPCV